MNRRSFLKLLVGSALFSFVSNKFPGGFPVTNTNRLGDLMREMRDPNLSPTREEEITRLLNEFSGREEIYKSWLSSQGSDPTFRNVNAQTGNFRFPPLGPGVRVAMVNSVSVPDSTNFQLDFDTVYYDEANFWNPSDPDVLTIPFTGKYLVSARNKWDFSVSSSGRRSMTFTGVGFPLDLFDTRVGSNNSTNAFYDEINLDSGSQVYVYVDQFTGAPIDLDRCVLTMRLLKIKDSE